VKIWMRSSAPVWEKKAGGQTKAELHEESRSGKIVELTCVNKGLRLQLKWIVV